MKADLSRTTFDRLKHFSRVVAQQGRVQLDADLNEQASLMLHQLRRLAADLIGPAGGPAGNLGFGLGPLDAAAGQGVADFAIGAGHYYVQGILCELEASWLPASFADAGGGTGSRVRLPELSVDGRPFCAGQHVRLADADPASPVAPVQARILAVDEAARSLVLTDIGGFIRAHPARPRLCRVTTFRTQPDGTPGGLAADPFQKGTSLVYLDVWERLVTALEDESIREVALGGPDTSARTRLVWQVGVLPVRGGAGLTPEQLHDRLQPVDRGRLLARAQPAPAGVETGGYRGQENHLYRVEIHGGSAGGPPTFKWSRDNGTVVWPIAACDGDTVVLATFDPQQRRGLAAGDWVEIADDDSVLANRAVPLLQVRSVDPAGRRVVLSGGLPAGVGRDAGRHPLLRRWDQRPGAALGPDNAAPIPTSAPDGWLELEDGVEIQFVDPRESVYRTGDYWLIPARVATGDIEWPREAGSGSAAGRPLARLPAGIGHHYAPLRVVEWDGRTLTFGRDCRLQFSGACDAAGPQDRGSA